MIAGRWLMLWLFPCGPRVITADNGNTEASKIVSDAHS
jgi:hypothetical protein